MVRWISHLHGLHKVFLASRKEESHIHRSGPVLVGGPKSVIPVLAAAPGREMLRSLIRIDSFQRALCAVHPKRVLLRSVVEGE